MTVLPHRVNRPRCFDPKPRTLSGTTVSAFAIALAAMVAVNACASIVAGASSASELSDPPAVPPEFLKEIEAVASAINSTMVEMNKEINQAVSALSVPKINEKGSVRCLAFLSSYHRPRKCQHVCAISIASCNSCTVAPRAMQLKAPDQQNPLTRVNWFSTCIGAPHRSTLVALSLYPSGVAAYAG